MSTRFVFRQCTRDSCRFRFPAEQVEGEGEFCPVCGHKTEVVANVANGKPFIVNQLVDRDYKIDALLDNIRSGYNVGSIFRTADGAALNHLYLAGITPTPEHPRVVKTALGAEQTVPWSYHRNALDLVSSLQLSGYQIWSLENTSEDLVMYPEFPIELVSPALLVIGNELTGIDPGILAISDRVIALPMRGLKESLNVVVAFGIAAYWLRYGRK